VGAIFVLVAGDGVNDGMIQVTQYMILA